MIPWIERPTIAIDLATEQTNRFAPVPEEAVDASRTLLDAVLADAPDVASLAIPLVQQATDDRYQTELEELGEAFDVDWRRLMLASVSYDMVIAALGCSTLALATSAGPVLARNMDWHPEDKLARASYLLDINRNGERQFINAGWPGSAGAVTGLSTRGFAVALNAVASPEGLKTNGYPVMLHIRRVLEDARDFDEACDLLSSETLAVSALFTVVGVANEQRVVIERSPIRSAMRKADGDEPLMATNHYLELYPPQPASTAAELVSTCPRYETLSQFFHSPTGDTVISDDQLLYALTDPGVIQAITAQHVIARPADQSIRLFVPRKFIEGQPSEEMLAGGTGSIE